MPAKNITLMEKILEENKRLRKRVSMFRKLKDIRLILVKSSSGQVLGIFSIPTSVMEKGKMLKMDEIIGRFHREFNQVVQIEVAEPCDTMVDLEAAMMALNQVDDQKEDDGIEDAR